MAINLVLYQNYMQDITGEGFKYKISNEGQRYCNCLSSDYSKNYKKEMEKVKTYVNSKSENEIHQFIYKQGLGE